MLGTKGKALLLSLALLLAAGCAAKPAETVDMSTRLADSGIAEKKTTYQTVTVEKQDMVRTLNMTGDVTYRLVRPVRTGNNQLILKEILVERNQEVKTGDPVVVLQGIGSASDIRQRELEIQAQRANLEERLAWYEEQIEKIRDQAAYTKVRREIRDKHGDRQGPVCSPDRIPAADPGNDPGGNESGGRGDRPHRAGGRFRPFREQPV